MFTSKEVTTLTRTEDILDRIYAVGEKDAQNSIDEFNCNLFARHEGNFARLVAKPLGTKCLDGFAPFCSLVAGELESKLH